VNVEAPSIDRGRMTVAGRSYPVNRVFAGPYYGQECVDGNCVAKLYIPPTGEVLQVVAAATASALRAAYRWLRPARVAPKVAPVVPLVPPAAKIADDLLKQTAPIVNNGARMLNAATQLSKMVGPNASEKLQAMLKFFNGIGFTIGKQGIVETSESFTVYSEDARYAFQFMKATGTILYGKIEMAPRFDYVWRLLQ
jgi:hypothetical protein